MHNFKIIGMTGSTGAGKSTVTQYFEKKGCHVINADLLAKEVVQKGNPCFMSIVSVFGKDILNSDGALNRKTLARKAFSSKENTQKLNSITHPFILMKTLEKIDSIRKQENNAVIILDAPLLFECNMDILCDYTICVICDKTIRLERIMKRDHLSKEDALLRMNAQPEDSFYIQKSDFVIDGSQTFEEIYLYADSMMKKITERRLYS